MKFDDLYQEIILDHYRSPRNRKNLRHISDAVVHENPTCGDSLKLDLSILKDGAIERLEFDGEGCALSVASASIMTEALVGHRMNEAEEISNTFISVMRGEKDPKLLDDLGDLVCFQKIVQFPVRVKCVTLAWHAFLDTIHRKKSLNDDTTERSHLVRC